MKRKKTKTSYLSKSLTRKNILDIGTLAPMWLVKVKSKGDMTEHLSSTNIYNYTVSIFQVKM